MGPFLFTGRGHLCHSCVNGQENTKEDGKRSLMGVVGGNYFYSLKGKLGSVDLQLHFLALIGYKKKSGAECFSCFLQRRVH